MTQPTVPVTGARPLAGRVAVVAGATRGAGRGIARMLADAGAFVYCTGRSVRGAPASGAHRPETLEETVEMIRAVGGEASAVRVDHLREEQVAALARRIDDERGRLDILVNDIWGGDELMDWQAPFWEQSVERGLLMQQRGVHTHLITSRHLVPLMVRARRGLVVEVTDIDASLTYRGSLWYDLAKVSVARIALALAEELRPYGVTALAIAPGFLRSEAVLDHLGVTEANWRDAIAIDEHFAASETPCFVGRAIAALAADPQVARRSGGLYTSWDLSDEYGFTDIDGARPHWGRHFAGVTLPEGAPGGPMRTAVRWRISMDAVHAGAHATGAEEIAAAPR